MTDASTGRPTRQIGTIRATRPNSPIRTIGPIRPGRPNRPIRVLQTFGEPAPPRTRTSSC